jgi:hypothetical protein
VRADLEMISIVVEISLEDWTRGEGWSAVGQRPVRELVEFFLDLDTKVRITDRPNAANPFGTFEDCAIEPFSLEGLRRGKSGNSRSDYSNALSPFNSTCQSPTPSSLPLTNGSRPPRFSAKRYTLATFAFDIASLLQVLTLCAQTFRESQ